MAPESVGHAKHSSESKINFEILQRVKAKGVGVHSAHRWKRTLRQDNMICLALHSAQQAAATTVNYLVVGF